MDFLQNIIEHKREELAAAKRTKPLAELKDGLETRKGLSLKNALLNARPAIIAEIKRRSPSKGALKNISNPAIIAKMFASSGAAAISILTDNRFFGGSIEDLQHVKHHVSIPVLRKDFLIDPYQIYESKYYCADVILLITRCLERNQLSDLLDLARSIGLEVLIEVECEDDIVKIDGLEVDCIGVNNRNLHTFEQTIDTSFRLYDFLPSSAEKISESALENTDQIIKLFKTGYRGFLIGETFMRSGDPGKTLRNFIGEIKKKI